MTRIRWRLLSAMVAVVVVTIALSGVFTRRVTHDELRIARRAASNAGRDVIVVDAAGNVVSTSPALRGAQVRITGDKVEITSNRDGRLMQLMLFMQPTPIPGTTNRAYFVPQERPEHPDESLDRRLIVMFALAILAAVVLTFLISRHITRPIEQLTAAVQEMARGRTRTNVPVRGRDEIARLATSFNEMSDAIANQQELRKRMVGDVAHELRTPVTNLRCELESVEDGLATPDITSLLEEVLHLQRLIDDLQELAIADAGGTKLQLQPLDLVATIESIVKVPIDVQSRPIVRADALRLGQIMRNLIANAAEYEPRVVIRAENGNAIVSVIDRGPGIPPSELESIFERFYRLDESRTHKGAGLGLAIVRRLVELHGGRVWAENGSEGGAIFTFTLPSHDVVSLGA